MHDNKSIPMSFDAYGKLWVAVGDNQQTEQGPDQSMVSVSLRMGFPNWADERSHMKEAIVMTIITDGITTTTMDGITTI